LVEKIISGLVKGNLQETMGLNPKYGGCPDFKLVMKFEACHAVFTMLFSG
jgi:hypothetical protein